MEYRDLEQIAREYIDSDNMQWNTYRDLEQIAREYIDSHNMEWYIEISNNMQYTVVLYMLYTPSLCLLCPSRSFLAGTSS